MFSEQEKRFRFDEELKGVHVALLSLNNVKVNEEVYEKESPFVCSLRACSSVRSENIQ